MSDLLPLFPLPSTVLFPSVFLPLHIFEPRYREMVSDALQSDRLIGMVLLKPGWEDDYEGRPAIYPIGCSGVITHVERLKDGCFNIVLRGLEKFRVLTEDDGRRYRRALIEPLAELEPSEADREAIKFHRARLDTLVAPSMPEDEDDEDGPDSRMPAAMNDEDLVNALAQYLELEAIEKQALLEQPNLRSRAESLIELLEMKAMAAKAPWGPNLSH